MIPQSETRGGFVGQLRDYALKGSDEHTWNEPIAQSSIFSRAVTLKGYENQVVRVDFEAKRVPRALGSRAVKTFFVLRASQTETRMPLEFLPQNVVDVLRREKVHAGNAEEKSDFTFIDPEETEDELDEFYGLDEMEFRHIRSVEYRLNGRGTLLSCRRENYYEDDDDGGVDIFGVRTIQAGSHSDEESDTLSLQGWTRQSDANYSLDILAHPDLRKLETKSSIKNLNEDLSFLKLVEQYSADRKLHAYTRAEHQKSMLSLLAFLRLEASSRDIQELL